MRWALIRVSLAVTVMVVLAFAVPLGLVVKELARDRAFADAERQAAQIRPALAITTDREQLERAVASSQAGGEGRMAVHVPGAGRDARGARKAEGPDRAYDIGRRRASPGDVEAARRGRSAVTSVPGGYALLQPTALSTGEFAVVEVYVPHRAVGNGVTTSWVILAGVGLGLVAGSLATADRLGLRLVRPAERLAKAAGELGEGRLGVRVREDGPAELRAAAVAFNSMADKIVRLLSHERELAADLSHRLRTPLTVLRLNAASLGDGPAADHTRAAVAQLEREVDQLIRAAREQGEPKERPVLGCDACEVIRDRMDFWSALAEDEGRAVRLAGVDATVRVPVARAELAAALDAMLGNVFRHTPEGTAFAVDVHHSEEAVIVLVSDAGPGIADPDAALRRGHGDGGPGSTGLGLDIVRRAAESTGGDVRIGRSVLGGTEVRVWLSLGGEGGPRRGGRRRRMRRVGAGRRS
ncbi:HAMP domain-containing histidine kinase [Streptomyces sp. HU2014]|uniref:Signal transduction histidine-protein kinase/phosphatase MprB n=1 Tax=Streptomyces albireticuli TaxID=1940 RepID=A0A1Z2LCA2_9ACTN|nr:MULTISPECIES: HAMP domain-containing sensor histidine kinase [Streptomyces]ARZ71848.1 histidine kinase [Streptomyces albireticuli]UQI45270.1 HAMP domain-containing histidine kinase [Streptomyces sp. HU2014]